MCHVFLGWKRLERRHGNQWGQRKSLPMLLTGKNYSLKMNIHELPVADPGEWPGGGGVGPPSLIFRPKWGPKGRKNSPPPSHPHLKVWIRHWSDRRCGIAVQQFCNSNKKNNKKINRRKSSESSLVKRNKSTYRHSSVGIFLIEHQIMNSLLLDLKITFL